MAEGHENNLQISITNYTLPVIIINPDNLAILAANKSAEDFFNYPAERLRTLSLDKIVEYRYSLHSLLSRQKIFNRIRLRNSEGRIVISDIQITNIIFNGTTSKMITIVDSRFAWSPKKIKPAGEVFADIYENLFKSMNVGVIIVEPSEFKILRSNAAFNKKLGFKKNELIGAYLSDLFFEFSDFEEFKAYIIKTSGRKNTSYGYVKLVKKSGKIINADYFTAVVSESEDKLSFVIVFNEISPKNFVKKELLKMSDLWNSKEDAIIRVDLNGKIESWNIGAEKIYGFENKDIFGESIFTIVHKDDEKKLKELLEKLNNTGKNFYTEEKHLNNKKRIIHVSITAIPAKNLLEEVTGAFFIVKNLTSKIEPLLKEKQISQNFKGILEFIPIVIGVHQNGKIVYINSFGKHNWGKYGREKIIGKSLYDIIHPEDKKLFRFRIRDLLKGKVVSPQVIKIVMPDHSIRYFESSARLFNYNGKPAIQFSGYDVTKRLKDEEERKKLLKKAEQHYSELDAVFESIPDAIYMGDSKKVKKANKNLLTLYDCKDIEELSETHKQVPDKLNMRDAETGERISFYNCVYSKALRGITTIGDKIITHPKTKKDIYIRSAGAPIKLKNKIVGAVVINTDITEQKAFELQLNLLYTSVVNIAESITITNTDGIIEWINPAFTKMTGYSMDEVLGKAHSFLKSNEMSDDFYRELWKTIKAGKTWQGEIINKKKNGQLYVEEQTITPVSAWGKKITHYISFRRDITEKKKAERLIMESEKKYRSLMENSFDGIALIQSDGRIKMWNTKFAELLGYTNEDIAKLNKEEGEAAGYSNWVVDENISDYVGKTLQYESKIMTKGGKYFDAEVSMRVIDKSLVMWVIKDITERKLSEILQQKLLDKLVEAQNVLRALSRRQLEIQETERRQIARELHDEIGQSLTALKIDILNVSQMVKSEKIKKQLGQIISLVDDTLKNVRELSLDLRPSMLDVLGLVPAVRWYIDRQTQRSGISGRVVSESMEETLSNEVEINGFRIIQEAVTNIIKHSHAKKFSVEIFVKSAKLHLVIRDDGLGFDVVKAQEKAKRGQSVGVLGMKERAELVGGWLDIFSSPKKGTKITAILPTANKTIEEG